MIQSIKPTYAVTGFIGMDDMNAFVILDKKNSSIHIHFHSKIFNNNRKPIVVKHADTKFPKGDDIAVIKEVINEALPKTELQIKNISLVKEKKVSVEQTKHPHRIIIRFKK